MTKLSKSDNFYPLLFSANERVDFVTLFSGIDVFTLLLVALGEAKYFLVLFGMIFYLKLIQNRQ